MATSPVNFRAITLPGIGELTAYSLGASSVFNANTPVSYYRDSLARLGAFYQQPTGQGQVTNPNNDNPWRPGMPIPPGYEVVTIRGRQVLRPKETQAGQILQEPDLRDQYPGIPLPPRGGSPDIPEGAPGGAVNPNNKGLLSDPASSVRKWIEETDAVPRGVMVLIGVVLLAIGVVSLR